MLRRSCVATLARVRIKTGVQWAPYVPNVFPKFHSSSQSHSLLIRTHVYRRVSSFLERLDEAARGDDPKASFDALRDVNKVAKEFAFIRPVLEALILHTRGNLRENSASPSRQHSAPQLQGPMVGA